MSGEISKPDVDKSRDGEGTGAKEVFSIDGITSERYSEIHKEVLMTLKELDEDDDFQDLKEKIEEIPEDDNLVERDVTMMAFGYYYATHRFIRSSAKMRKGGR